MSIPPALRDWHQKLGARFASESAEQALDYGDVAAEYAALTSGAALADRSGRGKLRLTGSERASFVHGMVTNDVNGLAVGRGNYVAMITVKGKMVGDARLLKRKDDIWLDLEPGVAPAAREFMDRHLISEDAEIHDVTEAFGILSFVGPKARDAAAKLFGAPVTLDEYELEERAVDAIPVTAVGTVFGGHPGVDLIVPFEQTQAIAEKALASTGARPVGFTALEIARVESGVPRFGQDMGEDTIPLEANLERAISYNKGCYVGQEVIARVHFRGHTNRRLVGFTFDDGGALPEKGTPLFRDPATDPKPLGTVTSAVQRPGESRILCLGYARREHIAPGTEFKTQDGRVATVAALPFTR